MSLYGSLINEKMPLSHRHGGSKFLSCYAALFTRLKQDQSLCPLYRIAGCLAIEGPGLRTLDVRFGH